MSQRIVDVLLRAPQSQAVPGERRRQRKAMKLAGSRRRSSARTTTANEDCGSDGAGARARTNSISGCGNDHMAHGTLPWRC